MSDTVARYRPGRINTPKIYAYIDNAENDIGAEVVLMEKVGLSGSSIATEQSTCSGSRRKLRRPMANPDTGETIRGSRQDRRNDLQYVQFSWFTHLHRSSWDRRRHPPSGDWRSPPYDPKTRPPVSPSESGSVADHATPSRC